MKDLLLKSDVIITPVALQNHIFTKDEKYVLQNKKKHIIKNLYQISPLFKHTIENFDKVEFYYFIISNYYRDSSYSEVSMKLSIYIEDYKYFTQLSETFNEQYDYYDEIGEIQKSFIVDNISFLVKGTSINIEWHNMVEDDKLDFFYRTRVDRVDTPPSNYIFSIILKNYEIDMPTPADRKKLYLSFTNSNYRTINHYKKSFVKNDPYFYEKYKLIIDE